MRKGPGGQGAALRKLLLTRSQVFSVGERRELRFTTPGSSVEKRFEGGGVEAAVGGRRRDLEE